MRINLTESGGLFENVFSLFCAVHTPDPLLQGPTQSYRRPPLEARRPRPTQGESERDARPRRGNVRPACVASGADAKGDASDFSDVPQHEVGQLGRAQIP